MKFDPLSVSAEPVLGPVRGCFGSYATPVERERAAEPPARGWIEDRLRGAARRSTIIALT
jgi:hypothetical protein